MPSIHGYSLGCANCCYQPAIACAEFIFPLLIFPSIATAGWLQSVALERALKPMQARNHTCSQVTPQDEHTHKPAEVYMPEQTHKQLGMHPRAAVHGMGLVPIFVNSNAHAISSHAQGGQLGSSRLINHMLRVACMHP